MKPASAKIVASLPAPVPPEAESVDNVWDSLDLISCRLRDMRARLSGLEAHGMGKTIGERVASTICLVGECEQIIAAALELQKEETPEMAPAAGGAALPDKKK